VLSLPALAGFRDRLQGAASAGRPEGFLAVLAKPAVAPLWALVPGVDQVIILRRGWRGMRETVRQARAGRFDFAYVLPKSFRSAWIPFLARIPGRRGLRGHGRDWMLSETVRLSEAARTGHQTLEMAEVFRVAGEALGRPPFLAVPEAASLQARHRAEDARARMGLGGTGPLVGLFPGAARGPSKRWPAGRFAELGRRLADERGWGVLVLGAPADQELAGEVAQAVGPRAVSLAGATELPELVALLQACRGVVANDSGGMHLAAAAGVPVVGLFGLTDPRKTAPVGPRCRILTPPGVTGRRDIGRMSAAAATAFHTLEVERVFEATVDLLGA
jgi:heptosyltransferase-2